MSKEHKFIAGMCIFCGCLRGQEGSIAPCPGKIDSSSPYPDKIGSCPFCVEGGCTHELVKKLARAIAEEIVDYQQSKELERFSATGPR